MIKEFAILGERCSGTNFLEQAMINNFDIKYTTRFGHKHYFGFNDYSNSENVLFIGIVRNPIDWINSLFRNPWHIRDDIKDDITKFMNCEFVSYYNDAEIPESRNMNNGKKYNNILQCRNVKNRFLKCKMHKFVKNYIFIRYEDLRDKYIQVMNNIMETFSLKMINKKIITVDYYKNYKRVPYKSVSHKNTINPDLILNHKDYNKFIEKLLKY